MRSKLLYLDSFLTQHQRFWRFDPFSASRLSDMPWQASDPQLCAWLASLTASQVEHYQHVPEDFQRALNVFLPDLELAIKCCELPDLSAFLPDVSSSFETGIPGRKLTQIRAMSAVALTAESGTQWLEWCSGKGYLGRMLCLHSQRSVTSIEFQAALCESGRKEAHALGLSSQHFIQADVLADAVNPLLAPSQHAVALHACGDLHQTLLQKTVHYQLAAVTLSPCCYHLTAEDQYPPLSDAGRVASLRLSRQELRIPLQETVTGGARVKRHRQLEMSYRLGFDSLLREALAHCCYTPIPSIKKSQLAQGFGAFCHWAAEHKQIALPPCDFSHYADVGEQRFLYMERLSLLQSVFKRPLEMWLVWDKALYLSEHGYQVSVGCFCARHVTPRNILIQATRANE